MKKTIVVNATNIIASSGGYVILTEFIKNIPSNTIDEYIIFTSIKEISFYNKNNIKIIQYNSSSSLSKYLWMAYGLRKWCNKNMVIPDMIISLQNIGVRYHKNMLQVVYYHSAIPLMDSKWSFWNKRSRNLWFYKNIYPILVKWSINKNTYFIVQQNFLKELVHKTYKIPLNRINVFRPLVNIDSDIIMPVALEEGKYRVFYPCSSQLHKNHLEIARMLTYLKHSNFNILDIRIYMTIKAKDVPELYKYIVENNLTENFIFLGGVSHNEVISYYKSIDLLIYPSFIECFTLPLLEIVHFNKPVLVADISYAREQLQGYSGAYFAELFNSQLWAEQFIFLKNKDKHDYIWNDFKEPSWNGLFKCIDSILHK